MSTFTFTKSIMLGFLDTISKTISCSETSRTETENEDILRAAIELLRAVADTQISLNRQRRNVLASRLLQLPNEVLSNILAWVVEERSYETMNTLRLVCSRFHRITESTPSFWSHIRFDSSQSDLGWTRAQLSRSMSTPLHISSQPKVQYDSTMGDWLKLVCGHIHRWKSCEMDIAFTNVNESYFRTTLEMIKGYLEEDKAPLLQNFVLQISDPRSYPPYPSPIRLFRGYAPRLRQLNITFFPVTWDDPILSGLSYMRIVMHDSPTLQQYGLLLESCPELEYLSINGPSNDYTDSNTETPFRLNTPLTKLKSLGLYYIPSSIIQSLLSSIRASPNPILIAINADARKSTLNEVMLNPPHGSPLYDAYNTADHMTLNANHISTIAVGPNGSNLPALAFMALKLDSPLLLAQPILSSTSCRPRIRTLVLTGDHPLISGSYTLDQLLLDLPELESLKFVDVWHQEVLNQLGTPMLGSGTSVSWLCPRLQTILIRTDRYDLQKILAFLKSRYTHPSGHHPTRLTGLWVFGHITARYDDVADEIADLIGRDVFECEHRRLIAAGIWADC